MTVDMDANRAILEQFLLHLGLGPDALVADCLDNRTQREEHLRELAAWAETQTPWIGQRVRLENVVRGFLICNSVQVITLLYPAP